MNALQAMSQEAKIKQAINEVCAKIKRNGGELNADDIFCKLQWDYSQLTDGFDDCRIMGMIKERRAGIRKNGGKIPLLWQVFTINDKEVCAYTLYSASGDEEQATRKYLAEKYDVNESVIKSDFAIR